MMRHPSFFRMVLTFVAVVMPSLFGPVRTSLGEVVTQRVEYNHADQTLHGFVAYDEEAKGLMPGVLIIHAWWGQGEFERNRAVELAEMGYVAFCLDMYGEGLHTEDAEEAAQQAGRFRKDLGFARRRAAAGLDVLAEQPQVDPTRLAVIGYCFGGTMALQLAYSGAREDDLRAAVSFHGHPLPPKPQDDPNIAASLLVLHGADDPLVPEKQLDAFVDAMKRAGCEWQLTYFGNAVHSFTEPGADEHGIEGVAYHERAAERSWHDMQQLFGEVFAR